MAVYVCTSFIGHYPVGSAAVIVAGTKPDAAELLERDLARIGLPQNVAWHSLSEIATDSPGAVILNDGNY